MGRINVVVVSAACALLLAGCTSAPSGPPGLTASPTTSETAAPTPAPTEDEGVDDLSDPELGIVFEDIPELEGDAADVYNWIATYNKEYWRTLTTNTVSPAFGVLASAEVQARMQQIADKNTSIQGTIGGVLHSSISNVVVDGDSASGMVCDDFREATFADPTRSYTPEEAGFGDRASVKVTLARVSAEDRWTIATTTVEGTC